MGSEMCIRDRRSTYGGMTLDPRQNSEAQAQERHLRASTREYEQSGSWVWFLLCSRVRSCYPASETNLPAGQVDLSSRKGLADLDHLKVFLAHPAFRANKIFGDIFPFRTGSYASFFTAFGFIVNPATNYALPLSHEHLFLNKAALRYLGDRRKSIALG